MKKGLLPIIMLVVVALWALFAVGMLTGTILAAYSIEDDVVAINTTYPEVEQELRNLPLADETGRIASEIDEAVKPIGPQFTAIVDAVRSIDGSVTTINGAVGTIHDKVLEINGTVHSIGGKVDTIDVGLTAVGKDVVEINDSAKGIKSSFDQILGHATSIDDRLGHADEQVEGVIGYVEGIRSDLHAVRLAVPEINQNAAAIVASPVVNLDLTGLPAWLVAHLLNVAGGNVPLNPLPIPIATPVDVPAPAAVDPSVPVSQAPVGDPAALPVPVPVEVPAPEAPADGDGVLSGLTKLFN